MIWYLLDSKNAAIISKDDAFNIILLETHEECLALLLQICINMQATDFNLSDLSYIISLAQVNNLFSQTRLYITIIFLGFVNRLEYYGLHSYF